ncbi:MAG: leucine-rich repeat protein, partial [Opitutales bacterium]|nr:leucine-rich repeat protein [Opitutales bacterium]
MITKPFLRFRKRSAFLSLVSLLLFAVGVRAQEWGGYMYEVVNGTTVAIAAYTGPGGAITIPSVIDGLPVTAIGGGAFSNRSDITGNLVIPEGVTTIGVAAFDGCSGFTGSLVIPEGVTSIGGSAFGGCSGFDGTLTLPSTLATIPFAAFSGCSGLTGNLVIPDGVTSIENLAFSQCSGFTGDLVIPEGVTSLGEFVFESCSGFDGTLTLPSTLATISFFAINDLSDLKGVIVDANNPSYSSVDGLLLSKDGTILIRCPRGKTGSLVIPGSVTTIEEYAFSGCSGLTGDLVIPAGVTSIGNYAFFGCSELSSVTFMGNAPVMGTDVFGYTPPVGIKIYYMPGATDFTSPIWQGVSCEEFKWQYTIANDEVTITGYTGAIENPVIPDTIAGLPVTAIGNIAFFARTDLTGTLTLPVYLESIGVSAFWGCSGLTGGLVIPKGVTSIGGSAFYGCRGLTGFTADSDNSVYSSVDGLLLSKNGQTLILCPAGKSGSLVIPEGVVSIGEGAFYGCSGLTGSLVIPEGVTSIGSAAFSGCSGFDGSLTLPSTLESIDSNAFSSCSGFTGNLVIPDGVTSIGDGTFLGCDGFSGTLSLSGTLESIGITAFVDCSGLTSFSVDANNPSYKSLDGLLLSKDGVVLIQCPAGKTGSLCIPDGVVSVGLAAFAGCSGIISVTVSAGVDAIGANAFYQCNRLSSITFLGDAPTTMDSNVSNDLIIYYMPGA